MCGNNRLRITYVVQIEIEALKHGLLWVTPLNYTKLIIEKNSKVSIHLLNSGNDCLANCFHQNLCLFAFTSVHWHFMGCSWCNMNTGEYKSSGIT